MPVVNKVRRSTVRTARFSDYGAIMTVETANGLRHTPRDDWERFWLDNPAFPGPHEWPIGWVLENENGRVVGSLGNLPFRYHLEGRDYIAAVGRGWAVDRQYRSGSLQLLLHQARQRGVDLHLTTTPNQTVAAVYTKLGWSRAPVGEWDRSALWIAGYSGFLRRYLALKAPEPVAGVAGTVLSPALRVRDYLRPEARRTPDRPGVALDWQDGFDGRFDGFWERLKMRRPGLLLSVRDRAALRWHYRQALARDRLWILTATERGALIGYAVFERRDPAAHNVTRTLLVDYQSLEDDPRLASAMLREALERCRRERIDVLDNPGCWFERPACLNASAPYHRNLKTWCFLYCAVDEGLRRKLAGAAVWHPTYYDGDASL